MMIFLLTRDALIISFANCLTSVFSGFVIFSYIGYLAKQTGQTVESVVQAGKEIRINKNT